MPLRSAPDGRRAFGLGRRALRVWDWRRPNGARGRRTCGMGLMLWHNTNEVMKSDFTNLRVGRQTRGSLDKSENRRSCDR